MMAAVSRTTFVCSTCFLQLLALVYIFCRCTNLVCRWLFMWFMWHLNNRFSWFQSTSPIISLNYQPLALVGIQCADKEAQLLIQCCIIITLPVNYAVELPVKQLQSLQDYLLLVPKGLHISLHMTILYRTTKSLLDFYTDFVWCHTCTSPCKISHPSCKGNCAADTWPYMCSRLNTPRLHLERRPWTNPLMANYPGCREYSCENSRHSQILPFQAGKAALARVRTNTPYFIFGGAKTKLRYFVIIVLMRWCNVYMRLNTDALSI